MTNKDFKTMKKELKLTNRDIGNIIGLNHLSITNQTQEKKKMPAWARGMVYIHNLNKLSK